MRFAVIGCGTITQRAHLPDLASVSGAEVVVLAGRTIASAEAAAEIWGGGDVVDDWETAVVRADVDAVLVATPNHLHAPIAIAAAAAGKHVLVEKPMAVSSADADRMLAAARAAGVVVMTAHNISLMGPFQTMAGHVAAGAVGEVTEVHAHWGHSGPQDWAPQAEWFRDPQRSGGGALLDLGVHVADLMRTVSGLEVLAVNAVTEPAGIDETASAVLELTSGAVGSLRASWRVVPGTEFGVTVQGTLGRLHLDARTPLTLHRDGAEPQVLEPEQGTTVCAAFVTAVTDSDVNVGLAGRQAVAIVEAAYRSAASGRREPVA